MIENSPFRLVASFAVALICVGLIPFLLIYIRFPAIVADRMDPQIEQAALSLSKLALPDLQRQVAFIDDRTDQENLVGVFSVSRKPLFGSISTLPENLPIDGHTHPIKLSTPFIHSLNLHAAAVKNGQGNIIVVARVPVVLTGVLQVIRDTFFFWILPAIAISVFIGAWLGSRTQQQVKAISGALHRIKLGGLDERLPVAKFKNTLGTLTLDINSMLDEINRLMIELRHAGNNIAHDLRSPLTRMRMRLRSARDQPSPWPCRQSLFDALESDIEQMLSLVSALLRLAEIDGRRQYSQFQDVDMADVVDTIIDFYMPFAVARNLSLTSECSQMIVRGDRDLLIEAIGNLIDNAIKFNRSGGRVQVRAFATSSRRVVEISDTGMGLGGLDLERLSSRSHRQKPSRTETGYGLGLSLVVSIARLHGAEFNLNDTDRGVVATMSFPGS